MTLLSDKVAAIAEGMGEFDHRARILRDAVVQLKAWESHTGAGVVPDDETITPAPPSASRQAVRTATCGLCGHAGPRYTTNCSECGERW